MLEDGLPLADAFGGWVYWDRVPRESIESVEVFRGGASNLYGSDALGGVVQFLSRQAREPALALDTSYGNERTPDLSFWDRNPRSGEVGPGADLGDVPDRWLHCRSDLAARRRRHSREFGGRVRRRNSGPHPRRTRAGLCCAAMSRTEFRHNGTPVQTNNTQMGEGAFGIDKQLGNDSLLFRSLRKCRVTIKGFRRSPPAATANR